MADEVRLWRHPALIGFRESHFGHKGAVEYIARPAADDEAREREIAGLKIDAKVWYEDAARAEARAERAEARCRQIAQRIIDRIGAVGPENAEEALDRLFRCDHTNAITLKRTDEARCAATARAERAEAALADAVKAERARIAKHLRDLGLAGPATQVERCPSCYDLGVVGAGDEPCTAVACDAHAAKMREDAARRAKA